MLGSLLVALACAKSPQVSDAIVATRAPVVTVPSRSELASAFVGLLSVPLREMKSCQKQRPAGDTGGDFLRDILVTMAEPDCAWFDATAELGRHGDDSVWKCQTVIRIMGAEGDPMLRGFAFDMSLTEHKIIPGTVMCDYVP